MSWPRILPCTEVATRVNRTDVAGGDDNESLICLKIRLLLRHHRQLDTSLVVRKKDSLLFGRR